MRSPRGLGWVSHPREQAETVPCETGAPQVAGGVETTLPLGGLREGEGGVADGGVGEDAVVCVGLQMNIGEDLPVVSLPAVGYQTGWSLKRVETKCEGSHPKTDHFI